MAQKKTVFYHQIHNAIRLRVALAKRRVAVWIVVLEAALANHPHDPAPCMHKSGRLLF